VKNMRSGGATHTMHRYALKSGATGFALFESAITIGQLAYVKVTSSLGFGSAPTKNTIVSASSVEVYLPRRAFQLYAPASPSIVFPEFSWPQSGMIQLSEFPLFAALPLFKFQSFSCQRFSV
jgi:hypothetical protein